VPSPVYDWLAQGAGHAARERCYGRWLFHSEFNIDNILSNDREGLQILSRSDWILKLDNVFKGVMIHLP
jgi:hypothetical protein